jgi:hypothetical protein
MHARFEAPQPVVHRWERHTLVLSQDSGQEELECGARLWQAITAMWRDNFVREEAVREREQEQRSDEDREQCLRNVLHRLDQQLRRQVAAIVATHSSTKEAGKLVAEMKRTFLAEARSHENVRAFLSRGGTPADEEELLTQIMDTFTKRCNKALLLSLAN